MDNATPHVGRNTLQKLNDYCTDNGKNVRYTTQPPNSPDLNICDLSFFSSLQKRADRLKHGNHGNLEGLIDSVTTAFHDYPVETLTIAYGHQRSCYNEILRLEGCNKYKSPHDHVRQRFAQGLPLNLCNINITEYNRLKHIVDVYFEREPL